MLLTIENVLAPEEVRQFRAHLDRASWEDGAATAGSAARQVKHNQQVGALDAVGLQLGEHLLRRLGETPQFVSAALPRRIHPPRFNRYAGGGQYGAHVDAAIMQLPGGQSLRTDLSATLFLAEPDAYEGGELEIEDAYGVQSVKLAAGSLVLYPSTSLHRVTPVTSGARVAAFFWVESLVEDDRARTLLYDLDQSIQELSTTLSAQDPRVLKLMGIYHNLVRRWAVT
ncbi:Fe2+-dependent dioxygenase [Pseudorhodoferax sp. Leaf274]|uniref:Fe2+-dependent dioxygenase n=1 Tax=Pseudorhodoferax sp. Leaf274 TaxID=1736318 RepID=UPI000703158A|nr:Fe2+-dependent dioxygenase [Pseudorhodoferax sp. Leaf274]KQP37008.1 hydroxylase [Pseudorhodoferax sp. Leaf274]